MSLENKVSNFSKVLALAAGAALSYSPANAAIYVNITGTSMTTAQGIPYLQLTALNQSTNLEKINRVTFPGIYSETPLVGSSIIVATNWTASTPTVNLSGPNLYDIIVTSTRTTADIGVNSSKMIAQVYFTTPEGITPEQLQWSIDAPGFGNVGTVYDRGATGSGTDTFAAPIGVPETNTVGYLVAGLGSLVLLGRRK